MKLINLFEDSQLSGHKELVTLVKRECSAFLKIVKDPTEHLLLRGLYPSSRMERILDDKVIRADVRKDRRPTDTAKDVSEFVDNWLDRKFDGRFRSEALFCVGDKRLASKYGQVHVILPIGGFNYCWSPKYSDFYQDNARIVDSYSEDSGDTYWENIKQALEDGKYTDKKMVDAITKFPRHEIMVNCDSYFAIPLDYFNKNFAPAWDAFK